MIQGVAILIAVLLVINFIVLTNKDQPPSLRVITSKTLIIICALSIAGGFNFKGSLKKDGGDINFGKKLSDIEDKTKAQEEKISAIGEQLNFLIPETEIAFAMLNDAQEFPQELSEFLIQKNISLLDEKNNTIKSADEIKRSLMRKGGVKFRLSPPQLKGLYSNLSQITSKNEAMILVNGMLVESQKDWNNIVDQRASYFDNPPSEKIKILIEEGSSQPNTSP